MFLAKETSCNAKIRLHLHVNLKINLFESWISTARIIARVIREIGGNKTKKTVDLEEKVACFSKNKMSSLVLLRV